MKTKATDSPKSKTRLTRTPAWLSSLKNMPSRQSAAVTLSNVATLQPANNQAPLWDVQRLNLRAQRARQSAAALIVTFFAEVLPVQAQRHFHAAHACRWPAPALPSYIH